jgi:TM2 domain-containing membrane protein YozV
MTRKPILASVLSFLVPGLGQICSGRGERGAWILLAAILVGNLNAIWLSLYGITSPGVNAIWTYALPRILHDVFAMWSVVFYIWQVIDTYHQAR